MDLGSFLLTVMVIPVGLCYGLDTFDCAVPCGVLASMFLTVQKSCKLLLLFLIYSGSLVIWSKASCYL